LLYDYGVICNRYLFRRGSLRCPLVRYAERSGEGGAVD
jgi:hypothetical protein